jgi:carboxylesterase
MPGAEPLSIDHDGPIGVLLLHGFTGSPKSMKPWAHRLAEQGWSVRVPRLPGHGSSWQDMNITRWQDWYAEADRNLRELQDRCATVFVMGLSMGGSLTLRLAEQHGAGISGIVLVNPAVHTERVDRFALPVIKHVVGSFPGISNDIAKPGQDEGAYTRIPLKAAASLQDLWKVVRTDIGKVTQPLLLFRSATDHIVEASNGAWIMEHVPSTDRTEVVLARSYHVATLDYDAEIIEDGSIEFVQRIVGA